MIVIVFFHHRIATMNTAQMKQIRRMKMSYAMLLVKWLDWGEEEVFDLLPKGLLLRLRCGLT
jgi:hypothetical protein